MTLKETIKKILKEETEGLSPFLKRVVFTFPEVEPYIDEIKSFIENSNCKKIEVVKFKHPALGLALHNGVLFNEIIFQNNLSYFLFVVFHEIAHQYQYKKYGDEKMYEFYLGEISLRDAAIAMKQIEIVADEFATRKIREFKKMGLNLENSSFAGFYKNAPLVQFEVLISQSKSKVKELGITDFDGVSNMFYNMVKLNT